MNVFLPTRYDERLHRLACGIEPIDAARLTQGMDPHDALRRSRVPVPVEVIRDRGPLPIERLETLRARRRTVYDDLAPLERHSSRAHVLLWSREEKGRLEFRIRDRQERWVPRRLRVDLAGFPASDPTALDAQTTDQRTRRPVLHPGATYPVGAATGYRGTVRFADGAAARWVRVEARRDAVRIGFAHADHRGEFLLLVEPQTVPDAALPRPLTVDLRVYGPAAAPATPDPTWLAEVDPHWDLPVETLGATPPAVDPVANGTTPADGASPQGWDLRVTRVVELTYGRLATSGDAPLVIS